MADNYNISLSGDYKKLYQAKYTDLSSAEQAADGDAKKAFAIASSIFAGKTSLTKDELSKNNLFSTINFTALDSNNDSKISLYEAAAYIQAKGSGTVKEENVKKVETSVEDLKSNSSSDSKASSSESNKTKDITVDAWGKGSNDCLWNIVKNNYGYTDKATIMKAIQAIEDCQNKKVAAGDTSYKKLSSSTALWDGDKIALPSQAEMDKAVGATSDSKDSVTVSDVADDKSSKDVKGDKTYTDAISKIKSSQNKADTLSTIINKYSDDQIVKLVKEYKEETGGNLYNDCFSEKNYSESWGGAATKLLNAVGNAYYKTKEKSSMGSEESNRAYAFHDATVDCVGTDKKAVSATTDADDLADTYVSYKKTYGTTMDSDLNKEWGLSLTGVTYREDQDKKIFNALFKKVIG